MVDYDLDELKAEEERKSTEFRKIDEEVDKLWDSGQWDDEKNEAVLQEHLRTPYNAK